MALPNAPARPPAPPPAVTFARRHPILTGFGILAGLSLFAAYFPLSALVTGLVVGGHATGADRLALRLARRAVTWIATHRPGARTAPVPPPPGGPAGSPGAPAPEPPAPAPQPSAPAPQPSSPEPAPGPPRHSVTPPREPVAAAGAQPRLGGDGRDVGL